MDTMYCPFCGSGDLTQEGLSATAVRLGYYKCLGCGRICRPKIIPASAAQADPGVPADQPQA